VLVLTARVARVDANVALEIRVEDFVQDRRVHLVGLRLVRDCILLRRGSRR
jgi:hypothetical protein